MYLFFDVETTGLSARADRIVQLAWALTDFDGNVEAMRTYIIKPDGFSIPLAASKIHGISTARACDIGDSLQLVLERFAADVESAVVVVAHNISFDAGILRTEFKRINLPCPIENKLQICTMRLSTEWCRLPKFNGRTGFKFPKLSELYFRLFGESFDGAHDAANDVRACMRAYFELVRKGIVVPPVEFVCKTRSESRLPPEVSEKVYESNIELNSKCSEFKSALQIRIAEFKQIELDNLVTYNDCEEFGLEHLAALSHIAHWVISNKSLGHVYSQADWHKDVEVLGAQHADLMRKTAFSVASGCDVRSFSEKEFVYLDANFLDLCIRVSLREEALLNKKIKGHRIENIVLQATHSEVCERISLAADESCPLPVQLILARDTEKEVKLALASNSRCLPSILQLLSVLQALTNECDDEIDVEIFRALAANSASPQSLLESLFDDHWHDVNIAKCFVDNKKCPPQILVSTHFHYNIGSDHPNFLRHLYERKLEEMARGDRFDRIEVARKTDSPTKLLEDLAIDESLTVLKYVAANRSTPGDSLIEILIQIEERYGTLEDRYDYGFLEKIDKNDEEDDYREAGAILVRNYAQDNPSNPINIANRTTDTGMLGLLSKHSYPPVRCAVANNFNIPTEILNILSNDPEESVRLAACENTATKGINWERRSMDPSEEVRLLVAANKECPANILTRLASDDSKKVRKAVANNSSCPRTLFEKFAVDSSGDVRMAALCNLFCSSKALQLFAKSPFFEYRVCVAKHPGCDYELFEILSKDKETAVRNAVMNNKECPLEIRANLYVEQFNGDLKHICLKKSRMIDSKNS